MAIDARGVVGSPPRALSVVERRRRRQNRRVGDGRTIRVTCRRKLPTTLMSVPMTTTTALMANARDGGRRRARVGEDGSVRLGGRYRTTTPVATRASSGQRGGERETQPTNDETSERERNGSERETTTAAAAAANDGREGAQHENGGESGGAAPERRDGPPTGFAFWVTHVLQPLELLKLVGKGFLFYAAFSVTAFALSTKTTMKSHPIPARYDTFLESAKKDDVRALRVDGNQLTWATRSRRIVSATPESAGTPFEAPREVEVVYHTSRPQDAPIPYETLFKNRVDLSAPDPRNAPNFLPWVVLVVFILLINIFRGQGQSNFGGSGMRGMGNPGGISMPGVQRGGRARDAIAPPPTTFADVAGVDEAKEELQEIVDILKHPEKYARLGARPPSGVMLVGAPGTGKTLLARAVAGEAGVPFISISASEFVELYVGMGAARVREVFARAKAQSPSIVFIDEIDAVAKSRGDGKMRGMGNDEREQTLNQLLTELDGFETESMVICIAATNRADTLDAALKRPGRFDRTVAVDRPDKQGRREILAVHTKRRALPLADDAGLDAIAQMTAGFTGADLENLVNEAALLAGRRGKSTVSYGDFEAAVLRTIAGIEKKRNLLSPREKETVAAHEVGHALVAAAICRLLPDAERPETLSIISRSGGALGFTYTPPTEDRWLMYKDELLGKIGVFMGGRAAEMVVCKRISSGASDDIQRATNLAYKSIAELGFSANIGPMSISTLSTGGNEDFLIGSDRASESDVVVEKEVKHIMTTSLLVACDVVRSNPEVMAELTKVLSEKEKVYGEELQGYLDRVVAPPSLEMFLRGDAPPVTPADVELMSHFPLPEVINTTR